MAMALETSRERLEKVRVIGIPRYIPSSSLSGWNYVVACPNPNACHICRRSPNVP
jgi:hypothetical protein